LGKVLPAGEGSAYVDDYGEDRGLGAFTPRNITQPTLLHTQLNKAQIVGPATDFEEFALNLCCVAAPVQNANGKAEGARGLSPPPRAAAPDRAGPRGGRQ
jgi:DNA-binding IclR family transcriptional regulator